MYVKVTLLAEVEKLLPLSDEELGKKLRKVVQAAYRYAMTRSPETEDMKERKEDAELQ